MSDSDAVLSSFVEGVFTCAKCGREAARVSVRGPGVPDPAVAGESPFGYDASRVIVEAGKLSVRMGGAEVDAAIPAVLAALATSDAAAIHRVDPEIAPFWCPTCSAPYCADEWTVWEVYDPLDQGGSRSRGAAARSAT